MKAKNYIVTAKGFVVKMEHDREGSRLITTTKLREATTFSAKTGKAFLERNDVEGFVWKPYEQEAVRDKYVVKQNKPYGFEDDEELIHVWQPVRMFMASDSDVSFLQSNKLQAEEGMTFEEAKAEAIRLNTEMLGELMEKIDKQKILQEND